MAVAEKDGVSSARLLSFEPIYPTFCRLEFILDFKESRHKFGPVPTRSPSQGPIALTRWLFLQVLDSGWHCLREAGPLSSFDLHTL